MLVKLKLVNQKKKKEERKMNKDTKDMLDKTISNDKEGFKDSFNQAVSDRIADKLATKHINISSNLLNRPNTEGDSEE